MKKRSGAERQKESKSRMRAITVVSFRSRLRARLLQDGPDTLSDSDLLELILSLGAARHDTKPIACRLLATHGDFAGVMNEGVQSLAASDGLPDAEVAIGIVQSAMKLLIRGDIKSRPMLSNWDGLLTYLNTTKSHNEGEQYRVLFLDNKNRLLADEAQKPASANYSGVQPHLVVQRALELQTGALILTRRHLLGDPAPSRNEVLLVGQIAAASKSLSMTLHDFIIIGDKSWTSFRKCGLL